MAIQVSSVAVQSLLCTGKSHHSQSLASQVSSFVAWFASAIAHERSRDTMEQ